MYHVTTHTEGNSIANNLYCVNMDTAIYLLQ